MESVFNNPAGKWARVITVSLCLTQPELSDVGCCERWCSLKKVDERNESRVFLLPGLCHCNGRTNLMLSVAKEII